MPKCSDDGVCWGPFDLAGKNAVVTGGAMEIGFGIAKRIVEAGEAVAEKLVGSRGKATLVQKTSISYGYGDQQ
jgi:NAD(P)-dependent dehydrogenase (short-subunit alcohol dehydrogenase family)